MPSIGTSHARPSVAASHTDGTPPIPVPAATNKGSYILPTLDLLLAPADLTHKDLHLWLHQRSPVTSPSRSTFSSLRLSEKKERRSTASIHATLLDIDTALQVAKNRQSSLSTHSRTSSILDLTILPDLSTTSSRYPTPATSLPSFASPVSSIGSSRIHTPGMTSPTPSSASTFEALAKELALEDNAVEVLSDQCEHWSVQEQDQACGGNDERRQSTIESAVAGSREEPASQSIKPTGSSVRRALSQPCMPSTRFGYHSITRARSASLPVPLVSNVTGIHSQSLGSHHKVSVSPSTTSSTSFPCISEAVPSFCISLSHAQDKGKKAIKPHVLLRSEERLNALKAEARAEAVSNRSDRSRRTHTPAASSDSTSTTSSSKSTQIITPGPASLLQRESCQQQHVHTSSSEQLKLNQIFAPRQVPPTTILSSLLSPYADQLDGEFSANKEVVEVRQKFQQSIEKLLEIFEDGASSDLAIYLASKQVMSHLWLAEDALLEEQILRRVNVATCCSPSRAEDLHDLLDAVISCSGHAGEGAASPFLIDAKKAISMHIGVIKRDRVPLLEKLMVLAKRRPVGRFFTGSSSLKRLAKEQEPIMNLLDICIATLDKPGRKLKRRAKRFEARIILLHMVALLSLGDVQNGYAPRDLDGILLRKTKECQTLHLGERASALVDRIHTIYASRQDDSRSILEIVNCVPARTTLVRLVKVDEPQS